MRRKYKDFLPKSARLRPRTCLRCGNEYRGTKYSEVCPNCRYLGGGSLKDIKRFACQHCKEKFRYKAARDAHEKKCSEGFLLFENEDKSI